MALPVVLGEILHANCEVVQHDAGWLHERLATLPAEWGWPSYINSP